MVYTNLEPLVLVVVSSSDKGKMCLTLASPQYDQFTYSTKAEEIRGFNPSRFLLQRGEFLLCKGKPPKFSTQGLLPRKFSLREMGVNPGGHDIASYFNTTLACSYV